MPSVIILEDGIPAPSLDYENGSIGVFTACDHLTTIEFGSALEIIGSQAFRSCLGLRNLTLPPHVSVIGDAAFVRCDCLESITLPGTIISIGALAFFGCPLVSLDLPDSLTDLKAKAFGPIS
jgi:hypothetical protein